MVNRLLVAAAGSGKTSFLIDEALDKLPNRTLITTFTISNEQEIRKKLIERAKCIPSAITVQTWISFLFEHGVRPFQGCLTDKSISGILPVNSMSGVKSNGPYGLIQYSEHTEFEKHYFGGDHQIYTDKIAKFVVRCNDKSQGSLLDRMSRIFDNIYIDEVQDLAGYDLEIIKMLFKCPSNVVLVGDPRQCTYVTHHEKKYSNYKKGRIREFIQVECNDIPCEISDTFLNRSFRCNEKICAFSSSLYPELDPCESQQSNPIPPDNHDHAGVFAVDLKDRDQYLATFRPMQLRFDSRAKNVSNDYSVMNFGASKGLTFDRVWIYPTDAILKYLSDGKLTLMKKEKGKMVEKPAFDIAKFYVAVTRARYSVAILCNDSQNIGIPGIERFNF